MSKKIIVISRAGISVSTGCELKLVCKIPLILIYLVLTSKDIQKSKQTSFDCSLYFSSEEMISFYSTIRGMYKCLHSDLTKSPAFHKVMDELARTCSHFRYYTQNINCVKRLLSNLDTKMIRLYSRVDQVRCKICNWVCEYKPYLFQGSNSLYY